MVTPDAPVTLDPAVVAQFRNGWLALVETAVWGDLKCDQIGALGKFRKRILDLGERLKSLEADRQWIPQKRERIKNLLGSCMAARDALLLVERSAQTLTGGTDLPRLTETLIAIHTVVTTDLQEQENQWAQALQNLNDRALDDKGEEE